MKFKYDWQYNVLNIYNPNKEGSLDRYYKFIKENHQKFDADICEVGVYQGKSILATALLLKELGSDKKVFGYDSFSGFPSYHEYDELKHFDTMFKDGSVSEEHLKQVKLNLEYRKLFSESTIDTSDISSSGDFSDTSLDQIRKKIEFLGLDNIELIEGSYNLTMMEDAKKSKRPFFAVLMDCDLYQSYQISLPFVWDRMSVDGYIFLDEYYSLKFPGARKAINEFCENKVKPQKYKTDPKWGRYDGDFERWYLRKME